MIHARDADDDMARILREETGKGRLPGGAALLHRRRGHWPYRHRAWRLYVSFTGILTFKNSDETARHRRGAAGRPHPGRDRLALSRARPVSRQALRAGLRGGTAKVLAEVRGVSPKRSRGRPPTISSGCSARCEPVARPLTFTFTILGCGSSMGVPRPALGWGACDPNNPKNRGGAPRCWSSGGGRRQTKVLVDTSPDLREQLLDAEVDWLDGVLMTHEHADHCPRHRRPAGAVSPKRRRVDMYLDAADLPRAAGTLRLLLRETARQRIPADRDASTV